MNSVIVLFFIAVMLFLASIKPVQEMRGLD